MQETSISGGNAKNGTIKTKNTHNDTDTVQTKYVTQHQSNRINSEQSLSGVATWYCICRYICLDMICC